MTKYYNQRPSLKEEEEKFYEVDDDCRAMKVLEAFRPLKELEKLIKKEETVEELKGVKKPKMCTVCREVSDTEISYCSQCQLDYEKWLHDKEEMESDAQYDKDMDAMEEASQEAENDFRYS